VVAPEAGDPVVGAAALVVGEPAGDEPAGDDPAGDEPAGAGATAVVVDEPFWAALDPPQPATAASSAPITPAARTRLARAIPTPGSDGAR
jgi:hypothetical protein